MKKILITIFTSLLLIIISCSKEDSSHIILTIDDLLVDTIYRVSPPPNDQYIHSFQTFQYSEYNLPVYIEKVFNTIEHYEDFIELDGNKLTIKEYLNDSLLIDSKSYYLNDEKLIDHDTNGYKYIYLDGYLIKKIGNYDSTIYTITNGNLVKEIHYDFYNYLHMSITSYEYTEYNNVLFDGYRQFGGYRQWKPEIFFSGKSSAKLLAKRTTEYPAMDNSRIERYIYSFDSKGRVIELITECPKSAYEWYIYSTDKFVYKNK